MVITRYALLKQHCLKNKEIEILNDLKQQEQKLMNPYNNLWCEKDKLCIKVTQEGEKQKGESGLNPLPPEMCPDSKQYNCTLMTMSSLIESDVVKKTWIFLSIIFHRTKGMGQLINYVTYL